MPFELSGYQLNVLVVACLYVLMAVGLQLTTGLAGQISLGHAAFYAIGAYAAALLATRAGWPLVAAVPASCLAAALAGLVFGTPSLRVRDDFLAIVTLGLGLIVQSLANNLPFTGGAMGISGVPVPSIGGFTFRLESYTVLVAAVTMLGVGLAVWLQRSRLGLLWQAVRDDDLAAASVGMPVRALKVTAFAVGSAYAGLAGALLAYHLGFVGAESFGFNVSITVLAMIVLGGLGSLPGAVVGALVLSLLPEVLRPLASYRLSIYGALLAFVIAYRPQGLLGNVRWGRRPKPAALAPPPAPAAEAPAAQRSEAPLLAVEGVSRAFGGVRAVDDVSFTVGRGEILALIGPNGAGKTTLLNVLSGVLQPDTGRVTLDGTRIDGLAAHRIARRGLARTFQNLRLFPTLTVCENVAAAVVAHTTRGLDLLRSAATPDLLAAAGALLARLGLGEVQAAAPRALPYGLQRRLEIARALALAPRLLLLDEPAAGLAHAEAEELVALVRELRAQGLTVVLIEHNMALVRALADRVAVLDHGQLIALGPLEQVATDSRVIEAYLGA